MPAVPTIAVVIMVVIIRMIIVSTRIVVIPWIGVIAAIIWPVIPRPAKTDTEIGSLGLPRSCRQQPHGCNQKQKSLHVYTSFLL